MKRGDLVKCIHPDYRRMTDANGFRRPLYGDILTVRATFISITHVAGVHFEEIVNKKAGAVEVGFLADHFRPVRRPNIDALKRITA